MPRLSAPVRKFYRTGVTRLVTARVFSHEEYLNNKQATGPLTQPLPSADSELKPSPGLFRQAEMRERSMNLSVFAADGLKCLVGRTRALLGVN